jgi:predicted Zn-dependent protease
LPFAEQAVQHDPTSFPARNALGRLLLELEQTDRAIKELETGVKLAPDSPEMRFALARAYSRAGRKNEATKERAEFMRLDKLRRARREGLRSPIPAESGQTPSNPQ